MMRIRTASALLLGALVMAACRPSQGIPSPTVESQATPSSVGEALSPVHPLVLDLGNTGDGSDVGIRLESLPDEAPPGDARALIVPFDGGQALTLDEALAVPSSGTAPLPSLGSESYVRLPAGAVDIDGMAIVEGVTYTAQILWTAPSGPALSQRSAAFTLSNEATVSTLVDEFPSATGGLAVDADGNLYAADIGAAPIRDGSTIYRISPNGDVQVWVSGEGLYGASGNTFDADGYLYQSSLGADTISRISPDGAVSVVAEDGVDGPVGIVAAPDGSLYVANCGGSSVQRFTPDGESERFAESPLFGCANGITIDDNGILYVASFYGGGVLRISPDGEVDAFAKVPGGNNGHIFFHRGLLWVVSRGGHQIYTLTLDGELALFAGTGERGHRDGPADQATFSLPNDIVASPDGQRLYVNEVVPVSGSGNHPSRIRVIELPRAE
jgi:sugar lactone lactonase YvrE